MMKKLSQTWRQRAKFVEKTPSNIKRTKHDGQRQAFPSALDGNSTSCNNDVPVDDKIDQMVSICDEKVVEISHENSTRCSLLFNSFALDSQALFAVDEMEQEHMNCVSKTLDIASLSPIIPDKPLPTNLSGVIMDNNDKLGTTANRIDQVYKCGDQNKFISTPNDKFFEEGTSGDKCGKTSTSRVKETIRMTKGDAIGMSSKEDGLKSNIGVCDAKTSKLDNEETCNSTPSMILHESPKKNQNCKMDGDSNDRSSSCINSQGSTTQDSTGHCLTQDQCTLSSWGLPASILEQYDKIGIKTMFQWQAQCLRTGNVLNGGNLVYSAPTSAGKTMVAEILMLKRILETKCKALFILPFVSVAREKMFYMKRMFGGCGLTIDGYMGSQVPSKGFDSVDIAVCTIEKANGLVNRLMESGQLHLVGVIVVDEIHLIGDPSRGYLLELLLTKVLYVTQSIMDHNVQIIGMSATLPNVNTLATWLKADLYYTDYRPVPLTEYFKVGTVLYDRSGNVSRELDMSQLIDGDEEHVLLLCQETVVRGNGVLIFCPTKSWCEKLAEVIAKHFNKLFSTTEHDQKKSPLYTGILDIDALKDVFEQLRSCQVGLDGVLKKTLRYGVAYHHAGLTYDERDVIEAAFRNGVLKVLVATSTLSSGCIDCMKNDHV
ncbi:DNA polymerase theta-like [Xenia sp. Carnegie-2017]|uniref:DNA polymerase theta-like n=1 Tax=Xenia sp. Carnegie-2017 TaxID=2897299 RepID=UPI001F04D242|nr:DNA polymerase theta-like [Xenia sp. Carnegie-2017]